MAQQPAPLGPAGLLPPAQLRAHRPDGAPIEVTVTVARVAPAIYGTARVGVSISEPVENWLRLFVSWVADEQPAPYTDNESPTPE